MESKKVCNQKLKIIKNEIIKEYTHEVFQDANRVEASIHSFKNYSQSPNYVIGLDK